MRLLKRLSRLQSQHHDSSADVSSGTVLLVDDDPDVRDVLTLALKSRGYSVSEAEDGGRGLECAQRQAPDAILLDANMPGIDGFEVLKRLRKDRRTASIPVIMLTKRSNQADVVVGYRCGAQAYLTKPVVVEEVLANVEDVLGHNRTAAA